MNYILLPIVQVGQMKMNDKKMALKIGKLHLNVHTKRYKIVSRESCSQFYDISSSLLITPYSPILYSHCFPSFRML